MRFKQTQRFLICGYLCVMFLMFSGFLGKKKKADIDVKDIKTVAVAPFEYTKFRNFSAKAGVIVPETMGEVFAKKCKWNVTELDTVIEAMQELKISDKKTMTQAQAKALGDKLGVDLVVFGNMPTYDENETSREIMESQGKNFTENMRELRVEYTIFFVRVSDNTIIFNEVMEAKERDTAKDPMMPDPPDVQLKHATTSVTKKLVKRFMMK